jgi:hypothetical protein
LGRSASLQYFNVGFFLETQCAVACVRNFDGEGFIDAKFHIAIINLFLVYRDRWCSATISTLIGKEERRLTEEHRQSLQATREIFFFVFVS